MRNSPDRPAALLVLLPGEHRRALLEYLESVELTGLVVDTCREVRACIESNPRIGIVITQVSLSDGNWRDVLSCLESRGIDARVVVSSSVADERFWSEVLWRGVYDVLLEPYDRCEIRRIVDGALRTADHPSLLTPEVSGRSGAQSPRIGGAG
jgi:DNA-binding NtrC family response regulator